MTGLAIACIQMEVPARGASVEAMAEQVAAAVDQAPWARLVVLGEAAATGFDPARAVPLPGALEARFQDIARRHGVWLIPGSVMERAGEHVFNTAPVIAPDGTVVARYRKIFPFHPHEAGISGGDRTVTVDMPGVGRIGLGICYDKWFPETIRQMCWDGAEVVIQVTATNTVDRDVELAMVRAAAASNQCAFVDVNTAGDLGVGRSVAVGPDGVVLHQAGPGPERFAVTIDLAQVRRVRAVGMHGLGQVLKSFRDSAARFPVYATDRPVAPAMRALGPLRLPTADEMTAGSMAGVPPLDRRGDRPGD